MKYIICLILSLSASFIFTQDAMSLEKAISMGLENNYGIKIAEQSIAIAQNNNSWARAGKGPTVDLNGSFSNSLTNDNNPASFLRGTYNNTSLGASVDAQWLIIDGGRIQIRKEQLDAAVVQQSLNKETEAHSLIREIVQSYYDVLFQEERMDILKNNLALSNERLNYEETKKDFGVSNSFNLIQFQNAILTDSTNIVSQEVQVDLAKRNFSNILDEPEYVPYDFVDQLSVNIEEIDEAKLKSVLEEENYTLKSLLLISELDQLNSRLERSNLKPTVSINGGLGVSGSAFKYFEEDPNTGETYPMQFSNRINLGLGANANWNIYDGGLRKQNIETAQMQEALTRLNFLEAQLELNNQLAILIANYNNQKKVLLLIDAQIQIAQKNLFMTEERFKAGQLSSLDFQNVQNQLLTIQFSKVNAIYNLLISKSEIDWLVGRFNN